MRGRRDAAKKLLQSGIAPTHQVKLDKISRRVASTNFFGAIADEFLEKVEREGKADATLTKKKWLIGLACNEIGSRPIAEISAAEILVPLRKVEGLATTKPPLPPHALDRWPGLPLRHLNGPSGERSHFRAEGRPDGAGRLTPAGVHRSESVRRPVASHLELRRTAGNEGDE